MAETLAHNDALLCADVRYLGPNDARAGWDETDLLARGRRHAVRAFPSQGIREEPNPGLFWSLAFALRRTRFNMLGGFDEGYIGYGAEDTDFGFRAAYAGVQLLFVGGAIVCHQYHESYEPPLQHVTDIVRNARHFYKRWGHWPMEGWLDGLARLGIVHWKNEELKLLRLPTSLEMSAARVHELME